MDENWRHLPPAARAVAAAATDAVAAAQRHDDAALAAAAARLAALDPARVGLVLGVAVRLLLEEANPDGLDTAAVRAALESSVRAAASWQPGVDPQVMAFLLAGALGVAEPAEVAAPEPAVLARHAALLVGDLLGARPAPPVLAAAFTEIEHAQVND